MNSQDATTPRRRVNSNRLATFFRVSGDVPAGLPEIDVGLFWRASNPAVLRGALVIVPGCRLIARPLACDGDGRENGSKPIVGRDSSLSHASQSYPQHRGPLQPHPVDAFHQAVDEPLTRLAAVKRYARF